MPIGSFAVVLTCFARGFAVVPGGSVSCFKVVLWCALVALLGAGSFKIVSVGFSRGLGSCVRRLSYAKGSVYGLSNVSTTSLDQCEGNRQMPRLKAGPFRSLYYTLTRVSTRGKRLRVATSTMGGTFMDYSSFVSASGRLLQGGFGALLSTLGIGLARLYRCAGCSTSTIFHVHGNSEGPKSTRQFTSTITSFIAEAVRARSRVNTITRLVNYSVSRVCCLSIQCAGVGD